MVKVKICGITNLEDARCAARAGAQALGFIFYHRSPRYVSPAQAARIIRQLPPGVKKTGVFVNHSERSVRRIARLCRLELLQFHGRQGPDFCRRFKGYKVIKAFRVQGRALPKGIARYKVYAWLFDTFTEGLAGGTGKRFNWELLKGLHRCGKKVFLSGGLDAKNVRRAITEARPDWVDVSSSLEGSPGKKDPAKIKRFIRLVKGAKEKRV
jgi:phosphoribosylanthranilate isomerase